MNSYTLKSGWVDGVAGLMVYHVILFILKKDGNFNYILNCQGLNKVTIKNKYLLPFIGEILNWLYKAKFFSKFDLKDAYYYIRIKEGDK